MGAQDFGLKPGEPIKTGDYNSMLGFTRNLSTNNGVVNRDGAYIQTPPVNSQSLADLSNASFDPSDPNHAVRSHSVIYAVQDGNAVRWYETRQPGSQAYYTLGNSSIQTVGTQVLDKWGTPVLDDNGNPVQANNGVPKYMIAVQAMVQGMKYVLRCDPQIKDTNKLMNGELVFWASRDGLKRAGNNNPEFSVVRYEYNYAPLSPAQTRDPLLDLDTRALFQKGVFVASEYSTVSGKENIDKYQFRADVPSVILFVQTDINTGEALSGGIDADYEFTGDFARNGFNFPISPALDFGIASSGNVTSVFRDGYQYYLIPYEYKLDGEFYVDSEGYVFNPVNGRVYVGVVPRDINGDGVADLRVADILNKDEMEYQFAWQKALEDQLKYPSPVDTYWSVPNWNNGQSLDIHEAYNPTEYANPNDCGYAECIYHPTEDIQEQELVDVAKIILPITKPLRSDVKPRPNNFPKVKIVNDDGELISPKKLDKVQASYYSTKSMGLIEPLNSIPHYQTAYYPVSPKYDLSYFQSLFSSFVSVLEDYDAGEDAYGLDSAKGILKQMLGLSAISDDLIGSVTDSAGIDSYVDSLSEKDVKDLVARISQAFSAYDHFPGYIEVPFYIYYGKSELGLDASEVIDSRKRKLAATLKLIYSLYPEVLDMVVESTLDAFVPVWEELKVNGVGNEEDAYFVTGKYLVPGKYNIPIRYGNDGLGGVFYMQRVEVDTVSSNDINYKSSKYKSFADKSVGNIDNEKMSTAGWIAYRYFSDNPDVSALVDEETFTFMLPSSIGDVKLRKADNDTSEGGSSGNDSGDESGDSGGNANGPSTGDESSGSGDTSGDASGSGDTSGSTSDGDSTSDGTNSFSGKVKYGSTDFDVLSFIPIARPEYEEIYGSFSVKEITWSTTNQNETTALVTVLFKPTTGGNSGKVYNDIYSLPFVPHSILGADNGAAHPIVAPHSAVRITTKRYKAHRSDWIPAFCMNMDQNEVLVPGMLVSYKEAFTRLTESEMGVDGPVASVGSQFAYALVSAPPTYSTVTEGTPTYSICEIEYTCPNIEDLESGVITDDDVWVNSIDVVERIPDNNILGNEYYIGVKLDPNGYPDIREPFGGFRDCDNLGNMTVFLRTTPHNVSFTCTGRLDFIPFGYAVPSRTPSCYYKTANDPCAVNSVSTRYIMTRINDEGIDNQLYLSGACYVPCSSLTSLGK